VKESFELKTFEPENMEEWNEGYEEWKKYKEVEI